MITKEFLIENYVNKRIPIYKLAKEYHYSRNTIIKYLRKFNISSDLSNIITKEELEKYYINQNLNYVEISKIFNCHPTVIGDYLKKYNIPLKSKSEAQKGRTGKFKRSEETRKKMSESRKGNKHYNWQGGITPLRNAIYNLSNYDIWVKEVFKRDNYECQECGKTKCYLEAHHLEPFYLIFRRFLRDYSYFDAFKDKEHLINLAKTYKDFWNVSNGKTLCWSCHGLTYKQNEGATINVKR